MALQVDTFVVKADDAYPCHLVAKRYRPPQGSELAESDPEAVTLVAAHASAMHKETREPVLERLFEQAQAETSTVKILEAWSIDGPSHGEAGILNHDWLLTNWTETVPANMYADAILQFLIAGAGTTPKIDFTKRKLVALGHSAGTSSLIWIHENTSIKFASLILVEPVVIPPTIDLTYIWRGTSRAAYERRDAWPTREAAYKDLRSSQNYKHWDERVFELFIKYGLGTHPAAKYKMNPWTGVVLACSKIQEAACYRGGQIAAATAVPLLARLTKDRPVHCIWAGKEQNPFKTLQPALRDGCEGRFASEQWIEGAGHMAIQEKPFAVADAIFRSLGPQVVASKL